jgi:putative membrane protein
MAYHYLWPEVRTVHYLAHIIAMWLVGALALWIVAQIIPGIEVRSYGAALLATMVIAIVNGTIGEVLKFLTFPLTFLTFGLFLLVIDAFLLELASLVTPGFRVRGFLSALVGAAVLTVLNGILRRLII